MHCFSLFFILLETMNSLNDQMINDLLYSILELSHSDDLFRLSNCNSTLNGMIHD